jgi:hypothetical protein
VRHRRPCFTSTLRDTLNAPSWATASHRTALVFPGLRVLSVAVGGPHARSPATTEDGERGAEVTGGGTFLGGASRGNRAMISGQGRFPPRNDEWVEQLVSNMVLRISSSILQPALSTNYPCSTPVRRGPVGPLAGGHGPFGGA